LLRFRLRSVSFGGQVARNDDLMRHDFAVPRRVAPELCTMFTPSKIRERREGRALVAPVARQRQKKLAAVTTGLAEHPAFPARWF
jgi:hypothetical protein